MNLPTTKWVQMLTLLVMGSIAIKDNEIYYQL